MDNVLLTIDPVACEVDDEQLESCSMRALGVKSCNTNLLSVDEGCRDCE